MIRSAVCAVMVLLCVLMGYTPAGAQSGPVLSVTVTGNIASATWTATPGATGYLGSLGTTPGGADLLREFPIATTAASGTLATGTYYLRVTPIIGGARGPTSNEAVFTIGNPAPLAPTGFTASTSGGTLTLSWNVPTAGGAPTDYILQAGSTFGAANLVPGIRLGQTTTSWSYPLATLPDGNYFLRLYAVNAQGVSLASSDAVFTKGSVPGVPVVIEPTVNGDNSVVLRWQAPVGGAAVTHYAIEAQYEDNRDLRTLVSNIPAGSTSYLTPPVQTGGYYWRLRAYNGATPGAVYGTAGFYVGTRPDPGTGPRTPNPAPGHRLPIPSYAARVVSEVAAAYPADVFFSCVEAARYPGIPQGNNQFMFKVLRELRKYDTRWTLNWKRGNVGDLSQDIINYNFGALPDEGTTDVYIIDIIAGHCGPRPDWTFIDQTEATARGGAIGRGTLTPYLNAGYPK
jgi:hypothetical protein